MINSVDKGNIRTGNYDPTDGLHLIDVEKVFDPIKKKTFFIHQENNTSYYWNSTENSLRIHRKNDGSVESNGKWEKYETYKQQQARVSSESADLLSRFVARGIKTNQGGNVLMTVSDKKIAVPKPSPNQGFVDYYKAEVVTAHDYYPFGMQMPGRKFLLGEYRYGFNGKENDNEVKGEGNQQDYGMRIYDPRLGKFLTVDPLYKSYPWNTPYSFAENDVMRSIDLDGAEKLIIHNSYDKYGRITSMILRGIRDKEIKEAIDLNLQSGRGLKLTEDDVYVI